MTARTIPNRRLLAGCIAAAVVLTLSLGAYSRSGRQMLMQRQELTGVTPRALTDDAGLTIQKNAAGNASAGRMGVGL